MKLFFLVDLSLLKMKYTDINNLQVRVNMRSGILSFKLVQFYNFYFRRGFSNHHIDPLHSSGQRTPVNLTDLPVVTQIWC